MAKREPSARSVRTLSPPPIYSSSQPLALENPQEYGSNGAPSGSTSAAGGELRPYDPFAMTNGERRVPSDDAVAENLLRLQRNSDGRRMPTNGSSTAGTVSSPETDTISHFSAGGGGGGTYAPSISGSQFDADRSTPTGEIQAGAFRNPSERGITNYITIARKATPHHRIFSLFYPNPTSRAKSIPCSKARPFLQFPRLQRES